jgi:hypothetical protein
VGDIYTQFEACAPYSTATHAKPLATLAPGQPESRGPLDYRRVRALMEAAEFRGFLAIEYEEDEPAETAVPLFARELREALAA